MVQAGVTAAAAAPWSSNLPSAAAAAAQQSVADWSSRGQQLVTRDAGHVGPRDMLKWLVNVAGQDGDLAADTDIHNKITEDPLATIKIGKKKKTDKVYSVNRYV